MLVYGGLALGAHGSGTLSLCGEGPGQFTVQTIQLAPNPPRTNSELIVRLLGKVVDPAGVEPDHISLTASVRYCRKFEDCMPIFAFATDMCSVLTGANGTRRCGRLQLGATFTAEKAWRLPPVIIRGTYSVDAHFHDLQGRTAACFQLDDVEVRPSNAWENVNDYRDAATAFVIAASASKGLGVHFPRISRGLLPQISGFLFIGILVGPYCTNLVTQKHICLIGGFINRFSLAFIGGAAGAEIFLPEFQHLLGPLALQVLGIFSCTLLFCGAGLLVFTTCGAVQVPALAAQLSPVARAIVSLLCATLMTARSPASAIAVVAELKCGHTAAAKMALGIAVLGDIAVLILFALCCQLVRMATAGGSFGVGALAEAGSSILTSVVLGIVVGHTLRFVLPVGPGTGEQSEDDDGGEIALLDAESHHGGQAPRSARRGSDLDDVAAIANPEAEVLLEESPSAAAVEDEVGEDVSRMVFRGVLVLIVLYATFMIADTAVEWTSGKLHAEPLLACVITSCITGHDEGRRANLLKALSFWTPHVLLPFFTLAGASLNLQGMMKVLPAAMLLVLLRLVGITVGSVGAGWATLKVFPEAHVSPATVQYMWTTLVAQAGVTMGLVLEISAQPEFGAWSREFSTFILGVVVINQIIGPVMCRVGLTYILEVEWRGGKVPKLDDADDSYEGESE